MQIKKLQAHYTSAAVGRVRIVVSLCVIVAIVILLLASAGSSGAFGSRIVFDDVESFDTGWVYFDGSDSIAVRDEQYPAKPRDTMIIYHELPELSENSTLFFRSEYQSVTVSINGATIYSYQFDDNENGSSFNKYISNSYCFVDIPERYSGQTIAIEFKTGSNSIRIPVFRLGTESAAQHWLINNNSFAVITSVIGMFFGIILLVMFFIKRKLENGYTVYLGLFLFLSALWVLTDSGLPQAYFGPGLAATLVSYYSFMLMPAPFLMFISTISDRGRLSCRILSDLVVINVIAVTLLHITSVCNMHSSIWTSHLLIIATILLTSAIMYRARKKSTTAHIVFVALCILAVFALVNMGTFYLSNGTISDTMLFQIGFLCFFLVLAVMLVVKSVTLYDVNNKAEMYMNLALWDTVTSLGNRTAFNEALETLDFKNGESVNVGIIIVDLNNLKTTNDFYGHSVGDELLCATAECMRRAFHGIGECYRIGGDEFAALFFNKLINMQEMEQRLDEQIERYNKTSVHKVSLAKGSAMGMLTEENARDNAQTRALYKIADDRMYKDKKAAHERSGNNR